MLVTIIVGIIDFDYLYGKQFIFHNLKINFEVGEGIVKI